MIGAPPQRSASISAFRACGNGACRRGSCRLPPAPSDMQMAHAGHNDAHGTGTVNSVDPAQHKINLSHQPISELAWPAMTMDFPVAAVVDLKSIKPGAQVNFMIEQQPGGMYEIHAITPSGGSR
jgi:Cu/Ag efflux protein CusF